MKALNKVPSKRFGKCTLGFVYTSICTAILLIASGCTTTRVVRNAGTSYTEPAYSKNTTPPGAYEYIWEEPMIDVIDVPPGLDPEGHYYRQGHQSVVEVRQGRWKYYRSNNQD
jgi:hypothetical protein